MSSSSKLVNVPFDADLHLCKLLADKGSEHLSANFLQDCEQYIMNNNDVMGLATLVVNEQGVIPTLFILEEQMISAMSLLAMLIEKINDSTTSSQLSNQFSDNIVGYNQNNDTSSIRTPQKAIALLSVLYNTKSNPEEKVVLLTKMIRIASSAAATNRIASSSSSSAASNQQQTTTSSSSSSLLDNSVLGKWMANPTQLKSMLDGWQISPEGRRELYIAAEQGSKTAELKQQFAILVVETYTSASNIDATGMSYIQKVAVGAIRDPITLFVQQRKIMSLPAIQALLNNNNNNNNNNGTDAQLYSLLKVFQEGDLKDYYTFIESNNGDSVLQQWELSSDDCVKNMRILSLCSLASLKEEITYGEIAETIQTSIGEVEKWIIASISSGLLVAKMNQLDQTVLIEKSIVRKFDLEQWKALQSKLHLWKSNMKGIMDSYKQSLLLSQTQLQ